MKTKNNKSILYICFGIFVAIAILVIFNTSGAWFTSNDVSQSNQNLNFGTVKVTSSPALSFTTTDLIPGNANPVRHLTVKNDGNTGIYVRFHVDILINNSPAQVTNGQGESVDLITYSANNAWSLQTEGEYFYDAGSLAANATATLDLTFVLNDALGSDVSANQITINFVLQSVQSQNNGTTYGTIVW